MKTKKHFHRKPKRKWGNFGTYVIRIELRKGPRPENPIYYEAKEKGEKIDIIAKYEELLNKGIEVAYFIELSRRSFGDVLREAIECVKLIYRGYFKLRKNFKKTLMKHAEEKDPARKAERRDIDNGSRSDKVSGKGGGPQH